MVAPGAAVFVGTDENFELGAIAPAVVVAGTSPDASPPGGFIARGFAGEDPDAVARILTEVH